MKVALIFHLEGLGCRLACRAAGLPEHRAKCLHRNARRLGLLDLARERQRRRRALYTSDEDSALIRRLEAGERLSVRALTRLNSAAVARLAVLA